jgi:hypothetical protein
MTRTFAVDDNNDLYLGAGGNLAIVSDLDAVLLVCAAKARTRLGEMVLQVDGGLPYFEDVFTGQPNTANFETALRAALLSVDGVTQISSLTITQAGNALNYVAEIVTVYGPGVIDG